MIYFRVLRLSSGYSRRLSLWSRKRLHDPAVADTANLKENKTAYKHGLSVFIHVVVVLLVVARGDVVHPFLVVQVPTDGLLDAFLKLEARLPA